MATTTITHRQLEASRSRQLIIGGIFLLIAFLLWFVLARDTTSDQITSFGLSLSGVTQQLPPLLVHSTQFLVILAVMSALFGGYQLARGFKRYTNLALTLVVGFLILGFLTWAAAGKSLNLAGLLVTTLGKAVPITMGALSGILCERAGVTNIAIEGMMLMSAMVSSLFGSLAQSLWIGLAAGMLSGALMALIHAVLSIKYKINQIVSGTVINIFSAGFTSYISAKFMQTHENLNNPGFFSNVPIPILGDIPVIGPVLFRNNIFIYVMFALIIILQIAYYKTKWGLRMRSVGEHPKAADTLGINVIRTRYIAVLLGGLMAGFAGAYFTLGSVGRFDEIMTGGRGFIGLAAMIFGNWNPVGAFGAGLLFGLADSLAARLPMLNIAIPSQFLLMAPYIATMVILAGVVGKGQMPAADGTPYEKE